jgi:hypothetical protein
VVCPLLLGECPVPPRLMGHTPSGVRPHPFAVGGKKKDLTQPRGKKKDLTPSPILDPIPNPAEVQAWPLYHVSYFGEACIVRPLGAQNIDSR